MTISSTHPTTELLDGYAAAPSMALPLDSDEAELLALMRDHPDEVCPDCHRPYWTPALAGRLEALWLRADAEREAERLAAAVVELVHEPDLELDPAPVPAGTGHDRTEAR